VVRISLGWVILWPFLDGMFALGFPTGRMADGSIGFFGGAVWVNGWFPRQRRDVPRLIVETHHPHR